MAVEDKKPKSQKKRRTNKMKKKFTGGAKYYKGNPKEIDLGIGDFLSGAFDKIKGIDLNIGGLSGGRGLNKPPKPPRTIIAEKGSMDMKSINPSTGKSLVKESVNKAYMDETGYSSPEAMEKEKIEYGNNPMKNKTLDKFKKYKQ
tara:strand:+ start:111 stop:545 length:435 start_codon:yes stop_codon:yes gene_type:complete